ncbi:hypothetical protein [Mesorhizobium sp. CN2-181]|uniref:hypothetical protein n=1 Tax=Mesorhizobium yinganensis TaxID=3157707 RepID=UPI0032B86FE0
MATFVETLAAASQVLGVIKELRDIDKGLSQGELKARMADLYSSVADIRMALADANEELRAKDREIAELKARFEQTSQLVEFRGYQYKAGPDGKPRGKPMCPVCMGDGKHVPLSNILDVMHQCPKCQGNFGLLQEFPG